MKEKITYNPQDIEDLLLNKSFDELHLDEKEFVLTQLENETEYREMRNTLISVKKIAAEQESVYVPNRIKEDLMQLMEKKKKPLGWFNLNSIGAFLFPSNTPLFKKPGLQFTIAGLMLLFVVNIGTDFVSQPNKELAINTNKLDDKEELEKEIKIKEDKIEQEPILIDKVSDNGTFPNINNELLEKKNSNAIKIVEGDLASENKGVVQDKTNYFDASDVKVEEIIKTDSELDDFSKITRLEKPKPASVPVLKEESAKPDFKGVAEMEMDEEVVVAKDMKIQKSRESSNTSVGDLNESVSLNSVVVTSQKAKMRTVKLKSQNLGDNSDVIDLLFVTL